MLHGRTSARGLAAFAGGASIAIIAARLLPPIAAQLAGSARGLAGGDTFQSLAQDHQAFLSMLADMEETHSKFARGQLLLRLKRRISKHALAEEDIIYPLLHDDAERADHARQLYAEHADIKLLLHALEHIPFDQADWTTKARELRELIERHALQEEQEEFPRLRQRLDDAGRSRLYGEVQREKALIL